MSDHHAEFEDRAPAEPVLARDDRTFAAPAPVSKASADAAFDLARFAEWLPRLGAVLWLDRRDAARTPSRASIGARGVLLLDHPALARLGESVAATAHTQVTAHGPREWLAFRDGEGHTHAKLFLLPDSDYLAWDEMAAAFHLAPANADQDPGWQAHTAFLRHALARIGSHWRARLLTFEHRALPWLQLLAARPPLRISLLGLELARGIARSEGAELVSPLHSSA